MEYIKNWVFFYMDKESDKETLKRTNPWIFDLYEEYMKLLKEEDFPQAMDMRPWPDPEKYSKMVDKHRQRYKEKMDAFLSDPFKHAVATGYKQAQERKKREEQEAQELQREAYRLYQEQENARRQEVKARNAEWLAEQAKNLNPETNSELARLLNERERIPPGTVDMDNPMKPDYYRRPYSDLLDMYDNSMN